ncbi:unnamed protein product [Didymodactylos carnosus]|uniref:Uncharacterized protein n=1 Tax=Didymodactylos carnosus TaxID=1234261 RepID=A0A814U7U5_9BILA|nr:unnamed protein product [Didymodactylos carnosus]CAF3935420.1 unnamed protein product [Didymodactylos carnosus]
MVRFVRCVTPKNSITTVSFKSVLTSVETLNQTCSSIQSPNGRFQLNLEASGNLRLSEIIYLPSVGKTFGRPIWWTNTGDSWPGRHTVDLTNEGELRVRVSTAAWKWVEKNIWWSGMIRGCRKDASGGVKQLVLEDNGSLKIFTSEKQLLCQIVEPVVWTEQEFTEARFRSNSSSTIGAVTSSANGSMQHSSTITETSRMISASSVVSVPKKHSKVEEFDVPRGRLAVVIVGLYRTNLRTCNKHIRKVIQKWRGTEADVFIYTYWQDAELPQNIIPSAESVGYQLKECYGNFLKSYKVNDLTQVAETFPIAGGPSTVRQCGGKLNQLQSQLKTLYLAGQLVRDYQLATGVRYDHIIRFRPDTEIWGNVPDLPRMDLTGLHGFGRIYLIHPGREHYFFCGHHDGRWRTGPSDQAAYGRASDMFTYFDMYLHFSDMIKSAIGVGSLNVKAKMDWSEMAGDLCAIECLVGYWMILRGIEFEVWWEWQQNIVRRGGGLAKDCPQGFDC